MSTGKLLQWMNSEYLIYKMLKSSIKRTLLCINSPSQPILMIKVGLLLTHDDCKLNLFESESKRTSIVKILYTIFIWENGGADESIEQSMWHLLVLSKKEKQIQ